MNKTPKLLAALAPLALLARLSACSGSEPEAPVDQTPDAPAGITVTDGRLNLPAVAGNPGAVYFTVSNGDAEAHSIVGAYVEGAGSAMFHQSDMSALAEVPVPAGGSATFAPGEMHVMVTDIDPAIAVGGEAEVTLTFASGDKVSFPARVLGPGQEG